MPMKIPMKNIVFAHCSESRLQRLATGCIVEFVASRWPHVLGSRNFSIISPRNRFLKCHTSHRIEWLCLELNHWFWQRKAGGLFNVVGNNQKNECLLSSSFSSCFILIPSPPSPPPSSTPSPPSPHPSPTPLPPSPPPSPPSPPPASPTHSGYSGQHAHNFEPRVTAMPLGAPQPPVCPHRHPTLVQSTRSCPCRRRQHGSASPPAGMRPP